MRVIGDGDRDARAVRRELEVAVIGDWADTAQTCAGAIEPGQTRKDLRPLLWLRQQRYCRDYGKTGREESRHAASIDPNGGIFAERMTCSDS